MEKTQADWNKKWDTHSDEFIEKEEKNISEIEE